MTSYTIDLTPIEQRLTNLENAPPVAPGAPPIFTDAQIVTALKTMLLGGTASIPTVGGDTPPSTGHDTLDLLISNSPNQPSPCVFNVIWNKPDGTQVGIAGPLTCTSYVGQQQQGAQHFSLKGDFGPDAVFEIVAAGEGAGVSGMFLMGANYNLVPVGIWGQINSRGGDAGGGLWTYNSNGNPMILSRTPPSGYTAPAPIPTDTLINGMTLTQLAAAGPITLPAGTFVGTAAVSNPVTGAGMGLSIVNASNHPLTYNKAIFVPLVKGVTIKAVTLTGAKLNAALGGNGAGIRDADTGIGFTAEDTEIFDCDNGILTFGSDITLRRMKMHDNGNPSDGGHTHNVYVGGNMVQDASGWHPATNTLTVEDYYGYGARSAHDIKSRAGITIINRMKSTTGGQGRNLDVPDGGKVDVTDAQFTIPVGAADRTFYGFATESKINSDGGVTTLTRVKLTDLTNIGGQLINIFDTKGILNLIECTYEGAVKPKIIGWGTVNGDFALAVPA
jgi:hypothetical protein